MILSIKILIWVVDLLNVVINSCAENFKALLT